MGNNDSQERHFAFMAKLPFDIVTEIFAYLDQQDCLVCMAVCRDWFMQIPHYTEDMWGSIQLSKRGIGLLNYRRARCLGRHVKNVQFKEKNALYLAMYRLLQLGCDEIKSLVFVNCCTGDQLKFVGILQQLGSRLVHLTMRSHNSAIPLLYILCACPKLTSFTYRRDYGSWQPGQRVHEQIPTISIPAFDKLNYLHIDATVDMHPEVICLLRKRPNLGYFIDASLEIDYVASQPVTPTYYPAERTKPNNLRLRNIFLWCPNLVYFASRGTYDHAPDDAMKTIVGKNLSIITANANTGLHHQQKQHRQLYHLAVCESEGYDEIAHFLRKNQDTLEHLDLTRSEYNPNNIDWSPIFQSLQMPRLHTLICDTLVDTAAVISMLNSCPSIKLLDLDYFYRRLDQAELRTLRILPPLQTVYLRGFLFVDKLSVTTLLQRLPGLEKLVIQDLSVTFNDPTMYKCLKHLKHLELYDINWGRQLDHQQRERLLETEMTVVSPAMFQYLALYSNLETIRLLRVPKVTYKLLLAIAHTATLKCLEVKLARAPDGDEAELLRFAHKLREKTMIEELSLQPLRYLNYAVLSILGDLPRLEMLNVRFGDGYHTRPPMELDTSGVFRLLLKSKSLKNILFGEASASEIPPADTIQKQLQEHDISLYNITTECSRNFDNLHIENIAITRI